MEPIYLDLSATPPIHPEVPAAGTLRFGVRRDNAQLEILCKTLS